MENSLYQLIQRRRHGIPAGIVSFCTAHPLVLEACMEQTLQYGGDLLIEATANQVNQFGGYTGMCRLISVTWSFPLPIHWISPRIESFSEAITWAH